jgi:hypothetical protein
MKTRKFGLIMGLTIVMLAALFAGCSSFPTSQLPATTMGYTVLGYVGPAFASYDAAFTAAKAAYSDADAVIAVKAIADDQYISQKLILGYYAVKFTEATPASKKFLGIF